MSCIRVLEAVWVILKIKRLVMSKVFQSELSGQNGQSVQSLVMVELKDEKEYVFCQMRNLLCFVSAQIMKKGNVI